jgi:hypothetical protein
MRRGRPVSQGRPQGHLVPETTGTPLLVSTFSALVTR